MAGPEIIGAQSASLASQGVSTALKSAAQRTGADFQYLYKVALRESGLDAGAQASTSSAAGLFQFIEQTWLGAVKNYGPQHGLAAESAAIERGADGRLSVSDPQKREAILDLRFNAGKASVLAGELARENQQYLEGRLGRTVKPAEVYAAHFLGAGGAAKLLSAPDTAEAAPLFGAAAKANRNVFFDGARAKTVGEIVGDFERTIGIAAARQPGSPAPARPDAAPARARAIPGSTSPREAILHTAQNSNALKNTVSPPALRDRAYSSVLHTNQTKTGLTHDLAQGPVSALTLDVSTRGVSTRGVSAGGIVGGAPLAFVVLQALDPTNINRSPSQHASDRR